MKCADGLAVLTTILQSIACRREALGDCTVLRYSTVALTSLIEYNSLMLWLHTRHQPIPKTCCLKTPYAHVLVANTAFDGVQPATLCHITPSLSYRL